MKKLTPIEVKDMEAFHKFMATIDITQTPANDLFDAGINYAREELKVFVLLCDKAVEELKVSALLSDEAVEDVKKLFAQRYSAVTDPMLRDVMETTFIDGYVAGHLGL